MSDLTRYVAISIVDANISRTFVVDGIITLDELFKMINDRPITFAGMAGQSIRSVAIHRDESLDPTWGEELNASTC